MVLRVKQALPLLHLGDTLSGLRTMVSLGEAMMTPAPQCSWNGHPFGSHEDSWYSPHGLLFMPIRPVGRQQSMPQQGGGQSQRNRDLHFFHSVSQRLVWHWEEHNSGGGKERRCPLHSMEEAVPAPLSWLAFELWLFIASMPKESVYSALSALIAMYSQSLGSGQPAPQHQANYTTQTTSLFQPRQQP